ncbi:MULTISPECIES: SpoIIE family protein phosphatase [Streptomyces]|uniref:SpoIIE family protein phosphatase n=1 Tax=Streptomyces TaxID=1883 RepID=UPI000C419CC5|nr:MULTISPECIES: SpoIIE family protein phosphatase [Streptomyces]PIB03279.1 hypothetical protein B1C81_37470 [Streptomyces sp. HG99]
MGRELDEAAFEALFSGSPQPHYLLDTDLRLVRFNAAAAAHDAFLLEDALGRPLWQWADASYREPLEAMLREVLADGVPRIDIEIKATTPDLPETVASVSGFRLRGAAGGVVGLALAVADVTDQYRDRVRLGLLRRATTAIGTTLDIVRTAQELADITVPDLADMVRVDVLDSDLRGDAPALDSLGEDLLMRCAGRKCAHEPASHMADDVGNVIKFPTGSPYAEVLAHQRPLLMSRSGADTRDPARKPGGDAMAETGAHSGMAVPLCARGVLLGLARFYREQSPEPFNHDDLELAVELAQHTALCLDNARLYAREHSVARILQLTLRPLDVPSKTAVKTAHGYLPSGAGGDWFDVIPLSGARVALVVGSPPGRGIRAAVAMGGLRAAIGALASLDLPPGEILERVHDLTTRLDGEDSHALDENPDGRRSGTTCLYAVYDPVARRGILASAGHPPPAIARPGGRVEFTHVPIGSPLGRGSPRYRVAETEMPEGCVMFLGNSLLLRGSGPEAPRELVCLTDALQPRGASLQEVCDAALAALVPQRSPSDGVLLLAKTRGLGADQVVSWTLPNDPATAADARARAERQLSDWGMKDLTFSAVLVVSELVTNAIRYSREPVRLRLIRDRGLIIEVTDDSSTAPHLRLAEDDDENGRGLYITAQLTERWGTRREHRGKTIWAELEPLGDRGM